MISDKLFRCLIEDIQNYKDYKKDSEERHGMLDRFPECIYTVDKMVEIDAIIFLVVNYIEHDIDVNGNKISNEEYPILYNIFYEYISKLKFFIEDYEKYLFNTYYDNIEEIHPLEYEKKYLEADKEKISKIDYINSVLTDFKPEELEFYEYGYEVGETGNQTDYSYIAYLSVLKIMNLLKNGNKRFKNNKVSKNDADETSENDDDNDETSENDDDNELSESND